MVTGVVGRCSTTGVEAVGVNNPSWVLSRSPSANALAFAAAAARFSSRSFRFRRAASESVLGFLDSFVIDVAVCV